MLLCESSQPSLPLLSLFLSLSVCLSHTHTPRSESSPAPYIWTWSANPDVFIGGGHTRAICISESRLVITRILLWWFFPWLPAIQVVWGLHPSTACRNNQRRNTRRFRSCGADSKEGRSNFLALFPSPGVLGDTAVMMIMVTIAEPAVSGYVHRDADIDMCHPWVSVTKMFVSDIHHCIYSSYQAQEQNIIILILQFFHFTTDTFYIGWGICSASQATEQSEFPNPGYSGSRVSVLSYPLLFPVHTYIWIYRFFSRFFYIIVCYKILDTVCFLCLWACFHFVNKFICILSYLIFLTAQHSLWDLSSLNADCYQSPRQWKYRVLTIGLPGNFLYHILDSTYKWWQMILVFLCLIYFT